jgi:hypothetical protein
VSDAGPTVVGLLAPSWAELHDGFTLARHLSQRGRCVVRRLETAPRQALIRQLVADGERAPSLVLLAARAATLQAVVGVAELLRERCEVALFGRELRHAELRRRLSERSALLVLDGDPCRAATRLQRALAEGRLATMRLDPHPAPERDLDALLPADFAGHEDLAQLALPLRTSRGYPYPCLFWGERTWELPVRRQSTGRVLDDLERYVRDLGARRFIFTDLVANTSSDALLEVARGVLERGLQILWQARVWPDPRLDRPALQLLRRSGCRELEALVFTAADGLHRALQTGSSAAAADGLLAGCAAAGIAVRVQLLVGLPGEGPGERATTAAWLARRAAQIHELDLEPCRLAVGAPLRAAGAALCFPRERGDEEWHDGQANNASSRCTWLREGQAWADHLGIWRSDDRRPFPEELAEQVVRRIATRAHAAAAASDDWRREQRLLAGVLHGREAFCGPHTLQLDLVGMSLDDARAVIEPMARLGVRRLTLGPPDPSPGEVLRHPDLLRVLQHGRRLGLDLALRTGLLLHEGEEPLLRRVADEVGEIELRGQHAADWRRLRRWLGPLAVARREAQLSTPRLVLTASLGSSSGSLAELVADVAESGVDRLRLRLARRADERLDATQRGQALEELRRILAGAVTNDGLGAALPTTVGCPPGFTLRTERGTWGCCCPNEVRVDGLRRRAGEPEACYATMRGEICRRCRWLAGCCVDRRSFRVRLGLLLVEEVGALERDLQQPDCGVGQQSARIETHPCLVGWDAARVDAHGDLYLCPENGDQSVANVLRRSPATVWYSRELNEARRMGLASSKVLPFVDRRRCREACPREARHAELSRLIEALAPEERLALQQIGAGDRLT